MKKMRPKKAILESVDGYWRLHKYAHKLLNVVRAKENSSYSITYIRAMSKELSATDGRRAITLTTEAEISDGLYRLTAEGFLLPVAIVGSFPAVESIRLAEGKVTKKIEPAQADWLLNEILMILFKDAGMTLDVAMLKEVLDCLAFLEARDYTLAYVAVDKLFEIEGEVWGKNRLVYVQMPTAH
jgi:hypothetical protein